MRPVCKQCSVEMRCAKSGAPLIEFDEQREPYRIWSVDVYRCSVCSRSVAAGFAAVPLANRGEHTFSGMLEKALKSEHLVRNYPLTAIKGPEPEVIADFRADLEQAGIDPKKYDISPIDQNPEQEE